jgi:hypothetical protein
MHFQDLKFKLLGIYIYFIFLEYERREKEETAFNDRFLKPNSFKSFTEEVMMDFASLSIYEDSLTLDGKVQFYKGTIPSGEPIKFNYHLCTSELKLLKNEKNFTFQQFNTDREHEMGIFFEKHTKYCEDSLSILLGEFSFIKMPNIKEE